MEFNKKNIKTFILIAFACILFYLGIKNIGLVVEAIGGVLGIMFPFILGAGIAFVINVPMTRIEYWIFHRTDRLKSGRRPLSFLLTLAAVLDLYLQFICSWQRRSWRDRVNRYCLQYSRKTQRREFFMSAALPAKLFLSSYLGSAWKPASWE